MRDCCSNCRHRRRVMKSSGRTHGIPMIKRVKNEKYTSAGLDIVQENNIIQRSSFIILLLYVGTFTLYTNGSIGFALWCRASSSSRPTMATDVYEYRCYAAAVYYYYYFFFMCIHTHPYTSHGRRFWLPNSVTHSISITM